MPDKIEYLVVDTTAFIKNKSLQDIATNIYTVQEVVDEIKNKRQLRSLIVLPYELKIKNVFSENIIAITEFSKKTGDYPSLSATDIKVMALTYQLEKENVGTEHLPQDPLVNRLVSFSKHNSNDYFPSDNLTGFYMPSKTIDSASLEGNSILEKECGFRKAEELSEKLASLECCDTGERKEMEGKNLSGPASDCADSQSSDNNPDEENSDEEGWITVENIAKVKRDLETNIEDNDNIVVACITADFAMQNVLKQMGLHVASVDGRQIHQLRTFILRCYACFKTTSIMTKLFCPNCGNKTLKKVSVSLREDGTQHIHINARRPLTSRGKKYSLPTPKGGKHASNPHIVEDQKFPDQRATKLARVKNDPLDPDYIAGFSPFAMRDVNSRSAIIGVRGSEVKHWMKKNPNESKRMRKK